MPVLPHAKKALRVSQRKAEYNRRVKSQLRNAIKQFRRSPDEAGLKLVYSKIDLALKGNILHHNKAARLKSRLSKLLPQEKTSTTKKVVKPKSKTAKKTSVKKTSTKPKVKKTTKTKTKK